MWKKKEKTTTPPMIPTNRLEICGERILEFSVNSGWTVWDIEFDHDKAPSDVDTLVLTLKKIK